MITGLQAIYKAQVTKTIVGLEAVLDEAIALRAKSHDNSWERNEATRMVEDIEGWLRCWRSYSELIRKDPNKMFTR